MVGKIWFEPAKRLEYVTSSRLCVSMIAKERGRVEQSSAYAY